MNAYGLHSIHGRAAPIATGLAVSRPDLSVWVVTGDGDALSIGGNHFLHALRRNVNITILLFNNQVYGLTKGQYSPTSPVGQVTGPTPMGSIDWPLSPVSVALGAEATFVARAIDTDRTHLTEVLHAAAGHKGAAFVEILQNCNVYNDGAFDHVRDEKANRILPEHGSPIRFGADGERGVRLGADGSAEIVDVADVGEGSSSSTTRTPRGGDRVRPGAAGLPGSGPSRSVSSGTWSGPRTTSSWLRRSRTPRRSTARATSRDCSTPATLGGFTSPALSSIRRYGSPGHRLRRPVEPGRRCRPDALALVSAPPAAADPAGVSIRPRTVEEVQRRLADLGFLPADGVDGIFGGQSQAGGDCVPEVGGPGARRHSGPRDPERWPTQGARRR